MAEWGMLTKTFLAVFGIGLIWGLWRIRDKIGPIVIWFIRFMIRSWDKSISIKNLFIKKCKENEIKFCYGVVCLCYGWIVLAFYTIQKYISQFFRVPMEINAFFILGTIMFILMITHINYKVSGLHRDKETGILIRHDKKELSNIDKVYLKLMNPFFFSALAVSLLVCLLGIVAINNIYVQNSHIIIPLNENTTIRYQDYQDLTRSEIEIIPPIICQNSNEDHWKAVDGDFLRCGWNLGYKNSSSYRLEKFQIWGKNSPGNLINLSDPMRMSYSGIVKYDIPLQKPGYFPIQFEFEFQNATGDDKSFLVQYSLPVLEVSEFVSLENQRTGFILAVITVAFSSVFSTFRNIKEILKD